MSTLQALNGFCQLPGRSRSRLRRAESLGNVRICAEGEQGVPRAIGQIVGAPVLLICFLAFLPRPFCCSA